MKIKRTIVNIPTVIPPQLWQPLPSVETTCVTAKHVRDSQTRATSQVSHL